MWVGVPYVADACRALPDARIFCAQSNLNSTFDGSCSAGRWNDLASCLLSRVLYWDDMVRIGAVGIDNLTTYKGQLQLLRRVCVFHNELAKCLPNTMANSVFGDFVEVVV